MLISQSDSSETPEYMSEIQMVQHVCLSQKRLKTGCHRELNFILLILAGLQLNLEPI